MELREDNNFLCIESTPLSNHETWGSLYAFERAEKPRAKTPENMDAVEIAANPPKLPNKRVEQLTLIIPSI